MKTPIFLPGLSAYRFVLFLIVFGLLITACENPTAEYSMEGSSYTLEGVQSHATVPPAYESFSTAITNPDHKNNPGSPDSELSFDTPSGTAEGDFLLAQISFDQGDDIELTAPEGWEELVVTSRNPDDFGQAIYYKWADASESSSYAWQFSTSTRAAGGMLRYTGVDQDEPFVDFGENDGKPSGKPTAATLSALSIEAEENARLVAFYGIKADTDFEDPENMDRSYSLQNSTGSGVSSLVVDQVIEDDGPTGDKEATTSEDTNQHWVAHLVALRAEQAAAEYAIEIVGGSAKDGHFNPNADNFNLAYELLEDDELVMDCSVEVSVTSDPTAEKQAHNCDSETGERNVVFDNPDKGTPTEFTITFERQEEELLAFPVHSE